MKWHTLQQKKRQCSLTWWKNEEFKKVELGQKLIKKEAIHSCEHESESFIRETIEIDTRLAKSLMEYSSRGGYQEDLVMGVSNETLESYGFKTNYLCVNAGDAEGRQQSSVVIEKKKSESLFFLKMKEDDSQRFVIKEEEQLLDVVTEDFADDGHSLRTVNVEYS